MQVTEMKALRSFYTHRHLFPLNSIKTSDSLSSLSFHFPPFSRQFHSSTLRFRAEESGLAAQSSKLPPDSGATGDGPRVWSIYDPISGRVATQKKRSDEEREVEMVSSKVEELEGERSYGSVKKGNLSKGEETHLGFSSFHMEIDDFLGEERHIDVKEEALRGRDETQMGLRSSDAGNENEVKGKNYVNVKKKTSDNGERARMRLSSYSNENKDSMSEKRYVAGNRKKGKSKVNWVCESCGYTDGQWWGYCRACEKVGTMKQFLEVGDVGSGGKVSGTEVSESMLRSWMPEKGAEVRPLRLTDVNRGINQLEWRIPL